MNFKEISYNYFKAPDQFEHSRLIKASYFTLIVPLFFAITFVFSWGIEKLYGRVKLKTHPLDSTTKKTTEVVNLSINLEKKSDIEPEKKPTSTKEKTLFKKELKSLFLKELHQKEGVSKKVKEKILKNPELFKSILLEEMELLDVLSPLANKATKGTMLMLAVYQGEPAIFSFLIENCTEKEMVLEILSDKDEAGYTPLLMAVQENQGKIVEVICSFSDWSKNLTTEDKKAVDKFLEEYKKGINSKIPIIEIKSSETIELNSSDLEELITNDSCDSSQQELSKDSNSKGSVPRVDEKK